MKDPSFVFTTISNIVRRCFNSSGTLDMKENTITIWVMAECKNRNAIALS